MVRLIVMSSVSPYKIKFLIYKIIGFVYNKNEVCVREN